uniref:Uncharacterized protein n=1 Tax=Oryza sativa subsp. japonica TaxID=39947 RepID=Q6ENK0_ORYSJ|nr:hypothetical protein [Oryza sativa Japonica Group]BAD29653.1 hypothetical protein [Oryza sativa Japonica Group]
MLDFRPSLMVTGQLWVRLIECKKEWAAGWFMLTEHHYYERYYSGEQNPFVARWY